MNRRSFIRDAGLVSTALAASTVNSIGMASRLNADMAKGGGANDKPNIIYIMTDEWGYYELSCMHHPVHRTPNLDKMAAEGIRFTQCLAGGSVCAPTRSVLLTGQHLGNTSVRDNAGGGAAGSLRADDVTIARVLKDAGYATGGFGKWGLGDVGTTGVPENHGFDVFYGYYHQVHAHCYFPRFLIRNSEREKLPGNTGDLYEGDTYAHYRIVEETMDFIRKNKDRPFFCYCPWTPPHGHWGIPECEPAWQHFKDKPWTAGQRTENDAKVYAAMIRMVDRQIGEMFEMLDELGIAENTIVFFCGDNGAQKYFGNFFGPNTDPVTGKEFRGGKRQLYEGGLRVPYLVHWPKGIKPNQVTDHLCYYADVMPTLAELAGAKCPEDIDGISFLPTLTNRPEDQKQHEYLYWEDRGWRAVRMRNWKAVRPGAERDWELYDLDEDIEEEHDLAEEHPDVISKMIAYAEEAHSPHVHGEVLDPSVRFTRPW